MTQKTTTSEMWLKLPWKRFQRETYRLQKRIYEASRKEDRTKVINLQRLLLNSHYARMIAIRQVTQLNEGKRTAGIDGKLALTNSERFQLEKELSLTAKKWKHQGLRKMSIPKSNGKVRTLKIPTISDRAWQCLIKLVLEPAHEATFHERSYGFRPGRSTHDAQKYLFLNLNSRVSGQNKKVLELDIEKCFDRINHQTILHKVIGPVCVKKSLMYCLKMGVNPDYPEQGTPQGGVLSPLLANIALNGIEAIHPSVRYADDMIYILKSKDDQKDVLDQINHFLTERGMKISQHKTKITNTTSGFDFLGWHFKVLSDGKFKCTPSKENYKQIKNKIKAVVNNSAYGATEKSDLLAPIVRGWRNYHKHCNMEKHNLWSTNHSTWKKFIKQPSINRNKADMLIKKAFPKVSYSVNKFINVKGNKSPFDGDIVYWSKRNSKLYNGPTSKALLKQNHLCGYCQLGFIDGQNVHLHHADGNHNNWKPNNLMAVHETCHDIIHYYGTKGKPNNPDIKSGAVCGESRTYGSN
jgi:RNA-directed DNA polymerase